MLISRGVFRRVLTAAGATLAVLLLPNTAFGQATRTYVSGVGDDANPCSRTAPCKTFAGAISKTAPAGEINALDSGGYGAVTITKSITINGGTGQIAGVLVNGTNAIVISAAPTDKVTLRGIDFNGLGTSLSGVRINTAKNVRIEESQIYGFQFGVRFAPSNNGARLTVSNTSIHDNSVAGVLASPQTTGGGNVLLRNDEIDNSNCGVVAAAFNEDSSLPGNCGNNGTFTGVPVVVATLGSSVTNNAVDGVLVNGSTAFGVISKDFVYGNGTGLAHGNGGTLFSFSDNNVFGNNNDGTPSATVAPRARPNEFRHLQQVAQARSRAWKRAHRRRH